MSRKKRTISTGKMPSARVATFMTTRIGPEAVELEAASQHGCILHRGGE